MKETVEHTTYLLATCDQFPYIMVRMCKRYKLQPNNAGNKHQQKAGQNCRIITHKNYEHWIYNFSRCKKDVKTGSSSISNNIVECQLFNCKCPKGENR